MRKDYHMHPTIITRPEYFDQFVQVALEKGIEEICVTDHMPLSFSKESDRLPRGTVAEYCARVREHAKRYEGILTVKCGIEIDYHPTVLDEIEAILEQGSFDYILGSSHMHHFVKEFERYTVDDFADFAIENSIKAAESGWFNTISHPDMYRYAFEHAKRYPLIDSGYDAEKHKDLFRELFRTAKKKGAMIELNPHLAEEKNDWFYMYPQEPILKWALEEGVSFAYGSDAHKPSSVGAWLDELENHPLYGIALRDWESK